MALLVVNASHGADDPERATLAFIIGTNAVAADQQCTIVLTVEGVRLAVRDFAHTVHKEGFRPLEELIGEFLDQGGQIWACGACCKPRGIEEHHLRTGARMVGAATVVEALTQAQSSFSF